MAFVSKIRPVQHGSVCRKVNRAQCRVTHNQNKHDLDYDYATGDVSDPQPDLNGLQLATERMKNQTCLTQTEKFYTHKCRTNT